MANLTQIEVEWLRSDAKRQILNRAVPCVSHKICSAASCFADVGLELWVKTRSRGEGRCWRIPTSVYEQIERAANLRGLSLAAYVIAIVGEDARRTIEETEILHMARADQIAFAHALIDPPAPNAKLAGAKGRYAAMIEKR
jgi:uncharacterized protein (DUF1778 family)